MTFQVNGNQGKYDNITSDNSVKYGKNAVDNHLKYMESPIYNDNILPPDINNNSIDQNLDAIENFANENDAYINSLPPLEYEYRYMPQTTDGSIDKKALFAAAEEEMGAKELTVDEFSKKFVVDNGSMTAEPLDINKDGKIDVSEYSTNILAADILSKGTTDPMKADGTITPKGLNAVMEYSKKSRAAAAANLYASIYRAHNLGN